jgi:phenylacetic acid degradation operon negative regulatory protein
MRRPTARSLVLDLLSTVPRGTVAVERLIGCAELFGIRENALRVALARLRAEERVESPERGAYRLGARAAAVQREVGAWRDAERALVPWRGGWIGVHTAGLSRTRARVHARSRALSLCGFRTLAPGLEVRPDNLRGGVAAQRARLAALGLDADALLLALGELDPASEARARALWDSAALVRGYRATCARLRASSARLRTLPRDVARIESFRLGGEAIRQIVLDPRLPEPLVPAHERRALVDAMHAYDRLGRECWAGALVPERTERGPADLRGLDVAAAAR